MNQGGRPKNVTEKALEEALAPIHEAIATLSEAIATGKPTGEELSKAEYLGQMQIAMAAHRGEIAISERFMRSMANQADAMYEGYRKIIHGGGPTNKELLDKAREEATDLRRQLALAQQREQTLEAAFKETKDHAEATG